MTFQKQAMFWAAGLVVFVLILYVLRPILLPFVAGMALAYALDPVADRFEKFGMSRLFATSLILILFALIFFIFLVALVPVLAHQIGQFAERLPEYGAKLQDMVGTIRSNWLQNSWVRDMLGLGDEKGNGAINSSDIVAQAATWLGQLLQSLLSGGLALVNLISLLTVTPVVAFYLLNDWDRMVAKLDNWLPREHVETIRQLASQIDDALAGFVRGQGLVCLFLGTFYAAGLSIVGLNFGLLIGFGAGVISFIPYVGSLVGFLISIGVALVQFYPDWLWVGAVAAVFFVGQFIEGNILQPKLVGGHVGLHPVWLIFALFAFGYLFGFVGMLLAVPLAAAVGVLARFAIQQYLNSPLYKGPDGNAPPS